MFVLPNFIFITSLYFSSGCKWIFTENLLAASVMASSDKINKAVEPASINNGFIIFLLNAAAVIPAASFGRFIKKPNAFGLL